MHLFTSHILSSIIRGVIYLRHIYRLLTYKGITIRGFIYSHCIYRGLISTHSTFNKSQLVRKTKITDQAIPKASPRRTRSGKTYGPKVPTPSHSSSPYQTRPPQQPPSLSISTLVEPDFSLSIVSSQCQTSFKSSFGDSYIENDSTFFWNLIVFYIELVNATSIYTTLIYETSIFRTCIYETSNCDTFICKKSINVT